MNDVYDEQVKWMQLGQKVLIEKQKKFLAKQGVKENDMLYTKEDLLKEKKQGAKDFFDYIKKLQPKDLVINTTNNDVGYFVMKKDLNKYLKNTERWGSPKNTIKKHELNKSLRSDKK
jgi:hypothetical protein